MISHIKHFNSEVQELFILFPEDETLKLIAEYKERKKLPDYYSTLDSFGFKIKFCFLVNIFENEKYIPCVKYYPKNAFGEIAETIPLVSKDSAFKSLDMCYKYLAKEYIYWLMRLPNLENVIKSF